ncbi:hypothetical protein BDQ17DRAFT_1425749 [Cyathus striatus]|nr:hypothetical protein BDQ17DRAFT_1425749 [Cyathus striatus]
MVFLHEKSRELCPTDRDQLLQLSSSVTTSLKNGELQLPDYTPRLYNPDDEDYVPIEIFGYLFSCPEALDYANRHNILPGADRMKRIYTVHEMIKDSLPTFVMERSCIVFRDEERSNSNTTYCYRVGSNKSAKDLHLASNLQLIRILQKALEIPEDQAPKWYRCQSY